MSNIVDEERREQTAMVSDEPVYSESTRIEEKYEEFYELPESISRRNRIWSVLSLVSAILSVLLCPFYYIALPLGVLAIIFVIIMRYSLGFFERISVVGLIIAIVGIVFSACSLGLQVSGLWNLIFSDK